MIRLSKITTRSGDKGESGLADGSRRPKQDARFDAIGLVDALNAHIGVVCARLANQYAATEDKALNQQLIKIQNDLFDAGADLATPSGKDALRIVPAQVEALERATAALNESLTPLTSFILPGGTLLAAELHVARTACRTAERACWRLHRQPKNRLNLALLRYLNRLSDFLFVAARSVQARHPDVPTPLWQPGKNRPS